MEWDYSLKEHGEELEDWETGLLKDVLSLGFTKSLLTFLYLISFMLKQLLGEQLAPS